MGRAVRLRSAVTLRRGTVALRGRTVAARLAGWRTKSARPGRRAVAAGRLLAGRRSIATGWGIAASTWRWKSGGWTGRRAIAAGRRSSVTATGRPALCWWRPRLVRGRSAGRCSVAATVWIETHSRWVGDHGPAERVHTWTRRRRGGRSWLRIKRLRRRGSERSSGGILAGWWTRWRSGRGRVTAHRRWRDAQHRALELGARASGSGDGSSRSCGRRRRCWRGRWCGSRAGSRSARRSRHRLRGVHHQHRSLELGSCCALQVEPALLAGRRRFVVLGPTVRTKHRTPPRGFARLRAGAYPRAPLDDPQADPRGRA
jgi:hypothetical protein